jgi:glyoxylase-like metal-dependent hydrolase (beta-lactamase superfamily II)
MTTPLIIPRRTFIADLGRGAFALAVLSFAGCGPSSGASPGHSTPSTSPGAAEPGSGSEPPAPPASAGGGDATTWERVNLGFVSSYILARGGEAAIVDTGVGGSAGAIETALTGIGIGWSGVGHLILTHKHDDHIGSAGEVLERATGATAYAGQEDIGAMTGLPRPPTAVADGDDVFGLTIVTTPGHTPGSISVLDPAAGVLVAGDALRADGGRPSLPNAQFTEDMDLARQSVVKLGGLTFETLLVGHGDPIEGGASALVAELGAGD